MKDEAFEDEREDDEDTLGDDLDCVDACTRCAQFCLNTAMTHCLEVGGEHAAPAHLRLMLDCAEVCQLSARLQLSGSEFAEDACALCAQVCLACAESCDELEGMEDCAEVCRDCARHCEEMADSSD